ncbi:hypothetical protein I4U23_026627 [Adineta vaga]|nr:hypothetical protein I4U23_026627 [Adineta vaga]
MLNNPIFSTSSTESTADDSKGRLSSVDSMFSNNDDDEEKVHIKQHQRLKTSSINRNGTSKRNKTVNSVNRLQLNEFKDHNSPKLFRRSSSHSDPSHRSIYNSVERKDSYFVDSQENDGKIGSLTSYSDDSNDDLRLEKTGWLNVKHWLTIPDYENLQITSKQSWKRFWIWLKDCHLHFYNDYLDKNSHLTINLIDSLCYPYPEYRHRQNVFSLTINTGDIYLLQSSNQIEIDQWIDCIHSNCLLKLNRRFLQINIKQLENQIVYEKKMLQSVLLQLKLLSNNEMYPMISQQIEQRERNLERACIDLFRNNCYLSIFHQNQTFLPNSIDLLAQISSTTKLFLYNLDAFIPCGFYAYVLSRKISNHRKVYQTILFDSNPPRKIILSMNQMASVHELLKRVIDKLGLTIDDYFLYCHSISGNGFIPNRNDILDTLMYSSVEVRRKITYQINLNNHLHLCGIDIDQQQPMIITIKNVKKGSEGEQLGVIKDDEIIMINNLYVKHFDNVRLNRYLQQIPIQLTLRSSRLNDTIHSRKRTSSTIKFSNENDRPLSTLIKPLMNTFNTNNEDKSSIKLISNNQQIQKVIHELIETEISYVQDLQSFINQYIEPLRNRSTIFPYDAIDALYKSIQTIYQFQTQFLGNLQSSSFNNNILISICEIFIRFSKDFKLYSIYCTAHLRINRLLNLHQNNEYLKEFLTLCNPSHQHSLSFQSYLIKPVQRILKYPLFLQQMFAFCNSDVNHQFYSKELSKLKRTIKLMNKINKYINSMQQLYEDFGQSFESFTRNSKEQFKKIIELNLPDLYAYGEMNWINMYRFLSKKNVQCLRTYCFVFRNGCLLLVREHIQKKNPDGLYNSQINKNSSDHFLCFLPIKDVQAEMIQFENKSSNHTWQLIQTDPITQLKRYYHFANKDAQTFVKTINSCISKIKWQSNDFIRLTQPSESVEVSSYPKRIPSSRSCHDFSMRYSLLNQNGEKIRSRTNRQSPSPVWKRRGTICLRKRPSSMTNSKHNN